MKSMLCEFFKADYVSSEGEPSFGNLGLTEQDVDDLVAFLNTLTDR